MDCIISICEVDYIIVVKYDNNEKIIDLEDAEIYTTDNFSELKFQPYKTKVEKSYLKSKDFSIFNNNNLGDSSNQLLNDAKNNGKDKSTTIRRINTDLGNVSACNSNKEFEENNINQINHTDNKLSVNIKIDNNNINILRSKKSNKNNENNKIKSENSLEGDTDELKANEKFHNISQKYYRHLSLKNISTNIKLKNNEEKLNEKIKKYLFNESQLTINLNTFEGVPIEPIGIINPSIYCFMICILQALLSIPELNYFFLSESYTNKNNKLIKEKENNGQDTPICDSFNDFIKQYSVGKKYIQIPRTLRIICNQLLGGMRMHDCQEFFVCFLEALQDELNKKEKINIPENLTMEKKWIIYRKVNYSFIDSIFTGLMRSTVQCKKCKNKSLTYDPFIDLSVSINKHKNLEKCLKQYFENENIDCEYKCENCKHITKVRQIFIFFIIFYNFRLLKNWIL